MQELILEKRKISSTTMSPRANPEWFVVDALGKFYDVTGYGTLTAVLPCTRRRRKSISIGRRLPRCVRSFKTLLDN